MNKHSGFKRIAEEMARYRGKNLGPEKLFSLYEEVFKIQESSRLKAGAAPVPASKEDGQRLQEGHFILDGHPPTIDPVLFKETAQAMGDVFSSFSGRPFPVAELLALPQLQSEALQTFAADIMENKVGFVKQFATGTKFNEETISFFLLSVITPFFQAEADRFAKMVKGSGWVKGSCPVCGSPPRLARFAQKDGRRLLFCPLCRTEWRFARLTCPFCGNTDHEKLRLFHLGDDKAHRVDVCNVCKHYIKTSNERAMDREVIPQVEDVATFNLDIKASEEGFQREA